MPADKRDQITERYRGLIEELGDDLGNVRGWKRRAAEQLGITAGHLSRVLSGKRGVTLDAAEVAAERLQFHLDFFLQEEDPISYHHFRRGPRAVQSLEREILGVLQQPERDEQLSEVAKRILLASVDNAPIEDDVRRLAEGILRMPLYETAVRARSGAPQIGLGLAMLFLTQRPEALLDALEALKARKKPDAS